jgi:lipopolysaccharide/colanic/teichoic acid biosynthesis glycosyltransferase
MDVKLFANELEQKAVFLQKAKKILNDPKRLTVNDITSGLKKKDIYDVNFIVRRLLDIIIASVLLLVLSPLFMLVMILIKLESKGPVIYKSKRAGRGCKIFNFYKFRTMFDGAENSVEVMVNLYGNESQRPRFFKAVNDPRITKVGSFLRNTSLDELPQLVNVIKGDMSLVGNRPLPIYEASTLTTDAWAERFLAPAGITGLWQVLKRGREDVSIEERLDLDINYARHNNIGRDLWILANTPKALFQKVNV